MRLPAFVVCPACQAALAKARTQQQLLGAAAKMEFAGVAFQPPAGATQVELKPVAAAAPAPAKKGGK